MATVWCPHDQCLESVVSFQDAAGLALHHAETHTQPPVPQFSPGLTVEAKFDAKSRNWKSATVVADQQGKGVLVTFKGYTDEVLIPRRRIRYKEGTVTLDNCLNSTSQLQAGAAGEGSDDRVIPADWESKIRQFAEGTAARLSLPATFTSYQRKLVHGLCDQLGLSSSSKGKDADRHTVVARKQGGFWPAHREELKDCVIGTLQVSRRRRAEAYVLREDGKPDVFLGGAAALESARVLESSVGR